MGRKSNSNSNPNELAELFRNGHYQRAAAEARKLTRRRPEDGIGWEVLARSLYQLGDLEAAEPAFRSALRLMPQSAHLHNELALLLLDGGRPEDAETCLRTALEQVEEQPGLLGNLGTALNRQLRYREAEQAYRRALVMRPDDPGLVASLAYALRNQSRYAEAARQFQRAVSLQPGAARLRIELAGTLRHLLRHAEAERALRRAIELEPTHAEAHANLGIVLTDQGRNDEALAAYRRARECDPDLVSARVGLLSLKTLEDNDPDIEALRGLLQRGDLDAGSRAQAHYAIGGALARHQIDPDTEWYHIESGAALRRQQRPHDTHASTRQFERLQAVFGQPPAHEDPAASTDTPRPVFIVGMPRSGTTLVEQALAGHPAIETIGEGAEAQRAIDAIAEAIGTTYPEGFDGLDDAHLARAGSEIRATLSAAHPEAHWVIDKQPDNHRHVGFLARALPDAVFVHVTRSPVDTCVSCFMRDFSAPWATYTNDLTDLGHYYRLYTSLMAHWASTLPSGHFQTVRYEDVVDDFDATIGGILDRLDLEWDPGCADFHRADRPVTTASRIQVRQPLYASSIGYWHRYAHHLGPLLEALGPLAPGADAAGANADPRP